MMKDRFSVRMTLVGTLMLFCAMLMGICIGSVSVPLPDTLRALASLVSGNPASTGVFHTIILRVRLPRVLCTALIGATLSLCGAAMQGLLRNPLADGSTLGVSAGASLGAVAMLAFGSSLPFVPNGSVASAAMLSAFVSLLLILSLAYALDRTLATTSIILIGVIFSMFASSLITLILAFADDKARTITFWTMGSLSGMGYGQMRLLALSLLLGGSVLLRLAPELNALAIGEDNARHIGVPVRRIKLILLITVSALIGLCVSVGGTISFVGLVTPHMVRLIVGPNHRRLLPASAFGGAILLLLCDLVARTLIRPIELPIGVVTSLLGAVVFVFIFYRSRKPR